jgi:hypothetical protein
VVKKSAATTAFQCARRNAYHELGRSPLGGIPRDLRIVANTRTHLSLDKDTPASRPATPLAAGRIVEIPQVNGLHHRYDRAAA